MDSSWSKKANCLGVDPLLFYPKPRWDGAKGHEAALAYAKARQVCQGCEVRQECLEAGMDELTGMWGGTTPKERFTLRQAASA